MGKWTDKSYITHSEWKTSFGGAKANSFQASSIHTQDSLSTSVYVPVNVCLITMNVAQDPVVSIPDGSVFERKVIMSYLKRYGNVHPITGHKLLPSALASIKFHYSNEETLPDCPITGKVFNDNTKVIANVKSGHVYYAEVVYELNIKAKNYKDLVTDEVFQQSDLVVLYDPKEKKKDRKSFYFIKEKHLESAASIDEKLKNSYSGKAPYQIRSHMVYLLEKINAVGSTGKILSKIRELSNTVNPPKINISSSSTESTAFTSTSMSTPSSTTDASSASSISLEQLKMFKNIKGLGYVSIVTNFGNLNFELYCPSAPKTCFNFIELSKKSYYDNVKFHRLIPGFMIQGGDPTGTGTGGTSIWNKPFDDEFIKSENCHKTRGILSMANSGPNTNTSQFFITFAPCPHLDHKHTVFGKLVGGNAILDMIEKVPTCNDEPQKLIQIERIAIVSDPFHDYMQRKKRQREKEEINLAKDIRIKKSTSASAEGDDAAEKSKIGKYI